MNTVCQRQLHFGSLFGKEVIANFEGGRITSDAGALFLRELDGRHKLTEAMAKALDDPREPGRVIHELRTLLRQRIFSIAMGYEDTNDSTTLRTDLALRASSGRLPETSADLTSQPTLCRFENRVRLCQTSPAKRSNNTTLYCTQTTEKNSSTA
jgi:hypothetical protein